MEKQADTSELTPDFTNYITTSKIEGYIRVRLIPRKPKIEYTDTTGRDLNQVNFL